MTALPYRDETPSQTAGPYVHIGLVPQQAGFHIFERTISPVLAGPRARGERIRIEGRVIDGAGAPCRDALVEIWQADAAGLFAGTPGSDPDMRGFGRVGTDFETGLYSFETVKPSPVAGAPGELPMAPHACLWIVARGINTGLHTRVYFDDEVEANAADPVLALVDPPARRATLTAARETRGDEVVYRLDIRLQGEGETVFFDV
jgi:protocatechuate 3,4-dioxygenase alpha subunit